MAWWKWVALAVVSAAAYVGGTVFGRITALVLKRVASRTTVGWDDEVVAVLRAPLTLGWATLIVWLLAPALTLPAGAAQLTRDAVTVGLIIFVFWTLSRLVGVVLTIVSSSQWARERPSSRSLLSVGGRVARISVLAFALVTLLSQLGFPVASLVAGLGLGGLAIGLAAQKSLENLFGGVSIAVDQPLREGDFVAVDADTVGTVETVGLRSTRIRTLDRTLVTIPNGKLADSRVESYSARDRIRLACTIGLVYSTTADQMATIIRDLEEVLRSHPKIWPDAVVVKFKELAASSLDIEIMAWFQTKEFSEFQGIRQEILLEFMRTVEAAGSSFAFPSRTVHVVDERQR
jgi:MscS family membrane protein